jgi:hypothetical protein
MGGLVQPLWFPVPGIFCSQGVTLSCLNTAPLGQGKNALSFSLILVDNLEILSLLPLNPGYEIIENL